jgi:hypothetical protein
MYFATSELYGWVFYAHVVCEVFADCLLYVVEDVAGCVVAVVWGVLWVWWRSIRVCGVVLGGCGGASVTMVLLVPPTDPDYSRLLEYTQ